MPVSLLAGILLPPQEAVITISLIKKFTGIMTGQLGILFPWLCTFEIGSSE
jgi:hypothetical protein